MRGQTREYIEKIVKKHGPFKSVLDVGSMNVSGVIKDLIGDADYIGLDMQEGDNVDLVANAHDLKQIFPSKKFDLVVCADTLEHDDKFWLTVEGLRYVTKRGGLMFIGVPSRRCPMHRHPFDYWRFMSDGVAEWFKGFEEIETKIDYVNLGEEQTEDEIYMWGRKPK